MNRTQVPRTANRPLVTRPTSTRHPATPSPTRTADGTSTSTTVTEAFASWLDEGIERARKLQARLSPQGPDRLQRLRAAPTSDDRSYYVPWDRTARIGSGALEALPFAQARTQTLETTVHEAAHHWIREVTGFPGLLAAGGPGRVGEGVAQVVAAAALALEGETAAERAHGMRLLDPTWQSTPVGELRTRNVPLSRTVAEARRSSADWWEDMGGVHVHSGILIHAHGLMAKRMGVEQMATVTLEAMEGLTPITGMEEWARLTLRTAERLHGVNSLPARSVRAAWVRVGLQASALDET